MTTVEPRLQAGLVDPFHGLSADPLGLEEVVDLSNAREEYLAQVVEEFESSSNPVDNSRLYSKDVYVHLSLNPRSTLNSIEDDQNGWLLYLKTRLQQLDVDLSTPDDPGPSYFSLRDWRATAQLFMHCRSGHGRCGAMCLGGAVCDVYRYL